MPRISRVGDLPRNTAGIKIYPVEPLDISDGSKYILFYHTDGMFSYCKTEEGGTIHLSVMTPLKDNEDGSYSLEAPAAEKK